VSKLGLCVSPDVSANICRISIASNLVLVIRTAHSFLCTASFSVSVKEKKQASLFELHSALNKFGISYMDVSVFKKGGMMVDLLS
jgi:predicted sugar kinase